MSLRTVEGAFWQRPVARRPSLRLPEAAVAVLATRVAMTTTQRTGYVYRIAALDQVYRAAEAANSAEASP
ncbi:MAG: hypothetical protein WBQ45_25660 [Roseiarcus sp.]